MAFEEEQLQIQNILDQAITTGQPAVLPAGVFRGNWKISNINGLKIIGAGKTGTQLLGLDPTKPTLEINGMWYSKIADMTIARKRGGAPALSVDKSPERGVQGNTFENLYLDSQGTDDNVKSDYTMTMCFVGGNGAQGSEQIFINCHFGGSAKACYYQKGFNALNNTFIGGNFQNYLKNGIELIAGSCRIESVAFQCANPNQIANDGWDIAAFQGGVEDTILITGCRTESPRFCKTAWSQPATIIGCSQNTGYPIPAGTRTIHLDRGRVIDCRIQGEVYIITNPDSKILETSANVIELDKQTKVVFVDATSGQKEVKLNWYAEHGHTVKVVKADRSDNSVIVKSDHMNNAGIHSVTLTKTDHIQDFILLGGRTIPKRYYFET